MRYFVKARVKDGHEKALLQAIDDKTLGKGSVAGGEYLRDMDHARLREDGTVCWVEVCYCPTPLEEEIPYWEAYFDLVKITNAHNPANCKDRNGTEYWACSDCDCTERLEEVMQTWGVRFVDMLREASK
ncbi:MAG: hypothetical protein D6737_00410 [Chloroflexi bacterium]|nr:MAG: hypothetical protein CUN54_02920 [Phototrophicales bacterium]RMF82828.1 MAG: hypothetical protein D6737_00410 [Chloroflexota bacterium]